MNKNQLVLHKWHDTERLSGICNTPIDDWRTRDFEKILYGFEVDSVNVVDSDRQWYIYIDNGANILGVAHLDSVQTHKAENHFLSGVIAHMHTSLQQTRLHNPFLDDRLGVYTLLQTLPFIFRERGLTKLPYDILLTIDEEVGMSSAELFKLPEGKSYLWGFEFDATGGVDAKVYQYRNKEWTDKLEEVGFTIEHGSYTDISYLGHLGVSFVNVACGYYNYHARDAYMVVEEYDLQLARFLKFYKENKDTLFSHEEKSSSRWSKYSYDYYDDYWDWRGVSNKYISKHTGHKTSYTPKGSRTLNSKRIERDWSWLTQGVKGKDYETWIESRELRNGAKLNLTVYYYMGANPNVQGFDDDYIMASICSECQKPHLVDELVLERGRSLCGSCLGKLDVENINLMSDWMEEGGGILHKGGKFIRILSGFDERKSNTCVLCQQPEWADKFSVLELEGLDPVTCCRWCKEEWSRYEFDSNNGEEELATPNTRALMIINQADVEDVEDLPDAFPQEDYADDEEWGEIVDNELIQRLKRGSRRLQDDVEEREDE